jgi:hypothetical protein
MLQTPPILTGRLGVVQGSLQESRLAANVWIQGWGAADPAEVLKLAWSEVVVAFLCHDLERC